MPNIEANHFTQTLMAYGGGGTTPATEPQRRAFCNWLLVEFMDDYPRRDQFIAAFSSSGTREQRQAEALALASDSEICLGDLTDAVFWACTKTDDLQQYAGDESIT